MLPIGTKKPASTPQPPADTPPQAAPPDEAEVADNPGEEQDEQDGGANPKRFGADRVDPMRAGYLGPEEGPFECQGCEFWLAPNSCEIVSGEIEAQGCCNLFTKLGGQDQEAGPDQGAPPQGEDQGAPPELAALLSGAGGPPNGPQQ